MTNMEVFILPQSALKPVPKKHAQRATGKVKMRVVPVQFMDHLDGESAWSWWPSQSYCHQVRKVQDAHLTPPSPCISLVGMVPIAEWVYS